MEKLPSEAGKSAWVEIKKNKNMLWRNLQGCAEPVQAYFKQGDEPEARWDSFQNRLVCFLWQKKGSRALKALVVG